MSSISTGQSTAYAHALVLRWKRLGGRGRIEHRLRMWNVPPWMLCQQHIGGEHVEMHMFIGTLLRRTSIDGYIRDGLVEVHNIRKRHDELTEEAIKRGYNYKSPLPEFPLWEAGSVDVSSNVIELMERCEACKERILFMEPETVRR